MKRILKAINEGLGFPKKLIDFGERDDKPLQKTNYHNDQYLEYLFDEWINEEDTPLTKTTIYEFLKSNKNYYAPNDKQELSKLIRRVIAGQGGNVNLNWIDIRNVQDMSNMFVGCINFNGDISKWDVSSVNDTSRMFAGCINFNGDISKWDVSGVQNMSNMFVGCINFKGNISKWDVSSVNDMRSMFKDCTNFNGNISGWDVSSVNDMGYMFSGCTNFNGNISKWVVSSVQDMSNMFEGCTNFNGDISGWDTSSVIDMRRMFSGCTNFNGNISGWDIHNVKYMGYMFSGSGFTNGISNWNFKKCLDMQGMFNGIPKENITAVLSMLNNIDPVKNNINMKRNIHLFTNIDKHKINMEQYNGFISDQGGCSYTSYVKFINNIFQDEMKKIQNFTQTAKKI